MTVFKVFTHLRSLHVPVHQIEFEGLMEKIYRSDKLGSVDEQQERISRLLFLLKDMPKPPPQPKTSP
jgi:hypothetical protein